MAENLFGAEDSAGFKDLARDQERLLNTSVVLQRFSAFTGGNPELGQAPTRTVIPIECSASLRVMTGRDILASDGLFKLGDLEMTTTMPVLPADNINGTEADQVTWNGIRYTIVGDPYPVPGGGGTVFWTSHWRRSS